MSDIASSLTFNGPYSAKPGKLEFEFPDELKERYGLYLWTIEFEGGYLINYIGKTIRSFPARFWDHKKWSESGRDVLDPDFISKGENWLLESPTLEQTVRLYAYWRIFAAPLDVDDAKLIQMESALIQMVLAAGGRCADFLGNKQKRPRVAAGERIRILVEQHALIHGFAAEINV